MDSSANLDSIHYTVLERTSNLQSTISSLQELFEQTKRLRESFECETQKIESDAMSQAQSFRGFSKHKSEIEAMENRITKSQAKSERLTQRLERARQRIGSMETLESQIQANISRENNLIFRPWDFINHFVDCRSISHVLAHGICHSRSKCCLAHCQSTADRVRCVTAIASTWQRELHGRRSNSSDCEENTEH